MCAEAKFYGKNESSVYEIVKNKKEICSSFSVTPQIAEIMATVCDKCLVKLEKALNLWVENMNRKRVPTDGTVMCQKALGLYKDFSKGSPEMGDTKPFIANKMQENVWTEKYKNY